MYQWTAVSIDFDAMDKYRVDSILKALMDDLPPHDGVHPEAYYKSDPLLLLREHGEHVAKFKKATSDALQTNETPTGEIDLEEHQSNPMYHHPKAVVSHGNRHDITEFHVTTDSTVGWVEYTDKPGSDYDTLEEGRWMVELLKNEYDWVPELPVWSIESTMLSLEDSDEASMDGQSPASYYWSSD